MTSYQVGQLVTLTTEVRNSLGVLTDATVTLVVTKPDGTTSSPSVSHPGTGLYTADFAVTLAGDHLWHWASTGAVITADEGQFTVLAGGLRLVSLDDLKEHLNIPASDYSMDNELRGYIDAAEQIVEALTGACTARTHTELLTPRGAYVFTHWRPVLSVSTVTEYDGQTAKTLTHKEPGDSGLSGNDYRVDLDTGTITRTSYLSPSCFASGEQTVKVVYTAGRTPMPGNLRLACKEQAAHIWRVTQISRAGQRRGGSDDQITQMQILGYAVPNRVIELCRPHRQGPRVA